MKAKTAVQFLLVAVAALAFVSLAVTSILWIKRDSARTNHTVSKFGDSLIQKVERPSVTPWKHGWHTDRVTATRYTNTDIGYNIGFLFPRNPEDCDRIELLKFMEAYDGNVFEGGGYPGAEMFVKFKDVQDRKSADKKLQTLLPELDKLVASFSDSNEATQKVMERSTVRRGAR